MDIRDNVRVERLTNGLELVTLPMHYAPVAAVMTCVRAGSALEAEGTRGLSHFIEHMMFKGTERISGSHFWGVLQSYGGWTNAYTSRDITSYHELLPTQGIEAALELEGDRLLSPVFDEREVRREKAVILEERRASSIESAAGALDEALFLRAYPSHPYGRPIIGRDEDISAFDPVSAADFHRRLYNPCNMVVVVAGRIDPGHIREVVEARFGWMEPGPRAVYPTDRSPWGPPGRESISHPSELPRFSIAFPSPDPADDDWPLLDMAANWLSGNRSSRLDELLVLGGKALGVSADGFFSACPGLFQIRASLYPETDVAAVEAIIAGELEALRERPLPEADYEYLKVQNEVLDLAEHASPMGAASTLALPLLVHGNAFMNADQNDLIRDSTPLDLMDACRRWLDPSRAMVVELVPSGSKPEMVDFGRRIGDGDITPPESIDISEIEISPGMLRVPSASVSEGVESVKLDNGLQVVMKPDSTFPLVSLAFCIPMASGREPWDRAGLAYVASEVMAHGTDVEEYVTFNRRLERIGASFTLDAGTEHSMGIMSVHSRDLSTGTGFISDLLRRPAFRQADVDRVVEEKITEIHHRNETPFGVALEQLAFAMSSPREAAGVPTQESLSSIGRDEAAGFHAACARPHGSIIVAVGRFDRDALLESVDSHFGDWTEPEADLPPLRFPGIPADGKRVCSSMNGRSQTMIVLGTDAPSRESEQYYTFRLLARILGDGMNSRLESRIREQNGLAYQVGCEHFSTALHGRFMTYLATSDEQAGTALDMVEEELDSAGRECFDGKLVDLFKASSVGRQAMNLLDYDSLAAYLLGAAARGRPLDQDLESARRVLDASPGMIRQAAMDWLGPRGRFVSMAGGVSCQGD